MELDFKIDKLTDSIRNVFSGDSFETQVVKLAKADLNKLTEKNGWKFSWRVEFNDLTKDVYKLTIIQNPNVAQGLVSMTVEEDHVAMHLLENAPFNLGKRKVYEGVAGNLVAFCCKLSFQHGFEGNVAFRSKTTLIEHYEKTLGAYHFGGYKMIIPTESARKLVIKYFKQ